MELVLVKDDLFRIAKRLRQIDSRYRVYFNRQCKRFEIHAQGAMQIALPFDRLDERSVEYVRKTRVENLEKLMREIEADNARAEKQKQDELIEQVAGGMNL